MNLQPLHDAYTRLRKSDALHSLVAGSKAADGTSRLLPDMSLSSLQTEVLGDNVLPGEALKQLHAFAPVDGWLTFQSAHRVIVQGQFDGQGDGDLLCGEAVNKAGDSLAIVPARSGLKLIRYTPEEGGDFLTDVVTHLGSAKAPGDLRYRRYWRPGHDASCRIEPFAACFIGFAAAKENNRVG